MRPHASRSRITYIAPERLSRSNYVFMRMERPWSIQSLAASIGLLLGLILIAMLIVAVGVLLPASGMTLRAFYVPLLFFTIGPVVARRMNWPPIILILITCVYAFFVIEQMIEPVEQTSSPVLAILILVLLAPVFLRAIDAIGSLDRPYVPTAAVLCFISALLAAVKNENLQALPVFVIVPLSLLFVVAALIIRSRAARLASSIHISPSAAYRLIDLSNWFIETPSVGVSVFSFWRTAVLLTTFWGGWHLLQAAFVAAELSVGVPRPERTDSLTQLMLHLMMLFVPILLPMGGMLSLIRYPFEVILNIPLALSDWLIDSHPSPNAVGIRSAAAYDWLGLPLRPLLVTTLLTFSVLLVVLLRTPYYPAPSAESLSPDILRAFGKDLLQLGLWTVCTLGISLLILCAPWFAYFSSIVLKERGRDGQV